MEISPIKLLRQVLEETENGGRVRSTTRSEIARLIERIDDGTVDEQTTTRLLDMVKLGFAAEKLSDEDLAGWLTREVWADMEIDSIGNALVGEAISRLEKREKGESDA